MSMPAAGAATTRSEAGFTVHTLEMDGPLNYLKGVAIIRGILRAGRFDVLNTHSRRDTVIAAAAGRLAGTPLIVRTRHLSNKVGSLWSYTRLPHCVTTVSDHVRQHLIDRGVPPDRVATVYSSSCCRRPWSIPRCAASWAPGRRGGRLCGRDARHQGPWT